MHKCYGHSIPNYVFHKRIDTIVIPLMLSPRFWCHSKNWKGAQPPTMYLRSICQLYLETLCCLNVEKPQIKDLQTFLQTWLKITVKASFKISSDQMLL